MIDFASGELRRRGRLSEAAELLAQFDSPNTWATYYSELISQGRDVEIDNLSLEDSVKRLRLEQLRLFPESELRDLANWYIAIDGALAYRVLCLSHSATFAGQLRRDLADRFETLRAESAALIRRRFPSVPEAELRTSFMERLDSPRMREFLAGFFESAGSKV